VAASASSSGGTSPRCPICSPSAPPPASQDAHPGQLNGSSSSSPPHSSGIIGSGEVTRRDRWPRAVEGISSVRRAGKPAVQEFPRGTSAAGGGGQAIVSRQETATGGRLIEHDDRGTRGCPGGGGPRLARLHCFRLHACTRRCRRCVRFAARVPARTGIAVGHTRGTISGYTAVLD
jgi:hypothetical protein